MSLRIFRLGFLLSLLIGCGSSTTTSGPKPQSTPSTPVVKTPKPQDVMSTCALKAKRPDDEKLVSQFELKISGEVGTETCSLVYTVNGREYQKYIFKGFETRDAPKSGVSISFKYQSGSARLSEIARFVWLVKYYKEKPKRPYNEDTGLGVRDGSGAYHVGESACTFTQNREPTERPIHAERIYRLKQELKEQKFELEFSGTTHTVMCTSESKPLFLSGKRPSRDVHWQIGLKRVIDLTKIGSNHQISPKLERSEPDRVINSLSS